MATPIIMPRQGQSVESCILVEWLVDIGATVEEGTPVASIETDKAVFEVESPAAGILAEILVSEGQRLAFGTQIGTISPPRRER